MRTTILILGANGMLGQALVRVFTQPDQYEVIAWDRGQIDITDQHQLEEKIIPRRPAVIINATGYNAVDNVEEDDTAFAMAQHVNGAAPGYLAQIAQSIGAVLVHYSTDYVFDGQQGAYDEAALPNPISRYGQTKWLGEQSVQAHAEKYYVIRTSKLFGDPALASGAKKSFFEVMIEQSKEHDTINVVDGERSCFTYVPDLAQATKSIIEAHLPYGTYHVVNEGGVTWYEGAVRLFSLLKKNIIIQPIYAAAYTRPAKRPASSVLKNTKLPKLRSYESALEEWLNLKQQF